MYKASGEKKKWKLIVVTKLTTWRGTKNNNIAINIHRMKCKTSKICLSLCLFVFRVYSFWKKGRKKKEKENFKQALHWPCLHGARSHDHEIMTWAEIKSPMLKWLSPKLSKVFERNHSLSHWEANKFCLDEVERSNNRYVVIKISLENKNTNH